MSPPPSSGWTFPEPPLDAAARDRARRDSDEGEDRSSGRAYLRSRAEARFLETLLAAPLWEAHGIGISTSDETILGGSSLETLCVVLERAAEEVEAKPDSCPVFLACRPEIAAPARSWKAAF
jgi:hypothetical protein